MQESCETCRYYSVEGVGDYGSGPYYSECILMDELWERTTANHDFTSDSPHFPFHPAPGCYRIDFWHTKFTDLIDYAGRLPDALEMAAQAFDEAVKRGEWILPVDGRC